MICVYAYFSAYNDVFKRFNFKSRALVYVVRYVEKIPIFEIRVTTWFFEIEFSIQFYTVNK